MHQRKSQMADMADGFIALPGGIGTMEGFLEILTWRQQVISDLTHRGVLALDVFPDQLTAALVNRYLEIKARHLL